NVTAGCHGAGSDAPVNPRRVRKGCMRFEVVKSDGLLQVVEGRRELALEEEWDAHGIVGREELERAARALGGFQGLPPDFAGFREVTLDVVGPGQSHEN